VALFGPDDGPAHPVNRVLVARTSGSGKTTVARQIAACLDIPHIEIDGLFHGAGWTPNPEFTQDVQRFSADPVWVTEWQYKEARPLLVRRADLMVWLDYSRPLVMWQVAVRTVRRRIRHEQLWNANMEPPLSTIFTDPEHIVRWAWTSHRSSAQRVVEVVQALPDLPVVRLKKRSATRRWLARLATDN
jgi:adenylate kinase family enzyme